MLTLDLPPRRIGPRNRVVLTRHALLRAGARGVRKAAIEAALAYGRVFHVRGAEIYVIGWKEVSRYRRCGVDLREHEGIHVVCRPGSGFVLTAYRNRDLRGLRPRRRNRSRARRFVPSILGEGLPAII